MESMGKIISVKAQGHEDLTAYLAEPAGKCRGAVLVIHEVWGLADHIKDVADRFADEGYLALAPELLADIMDIKAAGLMQEDLFNPEQRNAAQPRLRELMTPLSDPSFGEKTMARLQACFDYLHARTATGGRVAVVGFCFGGTYSFSLAVAEPRLKLAVPFYGYTNDSVEELRQIKCPIRAFYGEQDERLIDGLPALEQRMAEARVDFEATIYPDCGHAFFNDTNRFAYNQSAAQDAWHKALGYLREFLGEVS